MKRMREEKNIGFEVDSSLDMLDLDRDPIAWLRGQATNGGYVWLLAHALDGIIWGRVTDGALSLSSDLGNGPSPQLLAHTMLEAWLFGESAQVRLWRGNGGFEASRLYDMPNGGHAFDEVHRLWGTQADGWYGDFTILRDGREGLVHAVPLEVEQGSFDRRAGLRYRPVTLRTRHFLKYDEAGQVYIAASRLVELAVNSPGDRI